MEADTSDASYELDASDELDESDEVLEDYSLAEYPATDTFSDESIARWPAFTCSELGSRRIRLVKITPGPPSSTIRCEVRTCFLNRAPSYTAVSYTWGSPLHFREILIEGRAHSVPKNLWRFMDQARMLPNSDRSIDWLWIDALSIDQSDPQEKLDQVGIIASIFMKAKRVLVWLGPSYGNSDLALAVVHLNGKTGTRRDSRTLAGPAWSALHSLCERPYWRRLWVYQELKAAPRAELMCGNKLVPVRVFQEYLVDAAAPRLKDKIKILKLSSAGRMLRLVQSRTEPSLWSLMRKTRHLRCADPRDKAYAIHNMARPGKRRLEADYTISVPVLLNQILNNQHRIYPPEALEEVGRQCRELEALFHVPHNSMFEIEGRPPKPDRRKNPIEQFDARGGTDDPRLKRLLAEWCGFYSHKYVNRILSSHYKHEAAENARRQKEKDVIGLHVASDDGYETDEKPIIRVMMGIRSARR
jgi:hypothetical protein